MVWKPVYILLIVFSCGIDYYCGLKMGDLPDKKARKPYLMLSLISNLTVLGIFKYYNFFAHSMNDLFAALNMDYMMQVANLVLPWGISFYTFQALSYSLDVYKGRYKPERRVGIFSLYVIFFPQLVAGPIERASHLIRQFHFNTKFQWSNMVTGCRLILLGLFKKVVVADQLSPLVSHVYGNPEGAQGISVYIASVLFAQQVYCDFSGYSDMARGSARLLGVDLMENFKLPFFAKSYVNFWSQWHVSLMNWFKDYILFPLVKKGWSWPPVFMLIFLISGVWHGANWTFIVWGLVNGLLVLYSRSTLEFRGKILDRMGLAGYTGLRNAVQSFCVFNLFALGAVFFRAANIGDSGILISNLWSGLAGSLKAVWFNYEGSRQNMLFMGQDAVSFLAVIACVFLLECFQWQQRNRTVDEILNGMKRPLRFGLYIFVVLVVIFMSNVAETPFIYFQF
jgi:D-alanyl-lipoteichoic acid acyltransferase DltB (MBOAT superfamily)